MSVTFEHPTGKPPEGKPRQAARMLVLLAAAEFLGMMPWFSATAATPALVREFEFTASSAAWLTMAVQAGFVAGTLVSAIGNFADVINARRLFAIGCAIAAAANAAVTWTDDPQLIIALRALTGAALACVYPPGMKIAAGWFLAGRGFALAVVVGALTAGKAFPYLLQAVVEAGDWRTSMQIASALTVAGGALVILFVGDGPYVAATSPFDIRAAGRLFTTRGAREATFGYLGHMWELYAMWTWAGAFAAASLAAAGTADAVRLGSMLAFVSIGAGFAGCLVAGALAVRFGKAHVAAAAMAVSAACCALTPLLYGAPPLALAMFVAVWGFAVVADSAQFSALVAHFTPREYVGTALTIQTCAGFLLTMVTIRLVSDAAAIAGWQWAFLLLTPGPLLGILALRPLLRDDR